ncbi:MAG: hypothetical protein R3223_12875, partial [Longimicrobiales bacterium]|nr:hypothetical protein [Longimicrobiales bacterium]
AESEGGWRKTYGVEPAVELGAVTHVLVGVGKTVMGPALPSPDSLVAADTGAPREASTPAGVVDPQGPTDASEAADLRPIMLEEGFPPGEEAPGDSLAGGQPPGNP